ncbi:polysaccharide deacetylase family protein [Bradyrhizobium sp. USDA 4471]
MLLQTGSAIPDGQLCLTFDDGPGEHTANIAKFLQEHQIKATFFLIGSRVPGRRAVVEELLDRGHDIGNHTQNHPHLLFPDQVRLEILAAHGELTPFFGRLDWPLFFRPPYGHWPTSPGLNGALTKEGKPLGEIYAGPISWDFDGNDWQHWERSQGADDANALRAAVNEYSVARRGIVLMHDHSFDPHIALKNQTFRMVRQLVPLWKERGIQFVSLREAHSRRLLGGAM